jgi:hypothetical protein
MATFTMIHSHIGPREMRDERITVAEMANGRVTAWGKSFQGVMLSTNAPWRDVLKVEEYWVPVRTEKAIRFDSVRIPDTVGGDDRADSSDPCSFGRALPVPNRRLRQKTRRSASRSSCYGVNCAAG